MTDDAARAALEKLGGKKRVPRREQILRKEIERLSKRKGGKMAETTSNGGGNMCTGCGRTTTSPIINGRCEKPDCG